MCADAAVPVLADVAVVAQDLKCRRVSGVSQAAVDVHARLATSAAVQGVAMCRAVFGDVVERQHARLSFPAAYTAITAVCRIAIVFEPLATLAALLPNQLQMPLAMAALMLAVFLRGLLPEPPHPFRMRPPLTYRAGMLAVILSAGVLGINEREIVKRLLDAARSACPRRRI